VKSNRQRATKTDYAICRQAALLANAFHIGTGEDKGGITKSRPTSSLGVTVAQVAHRSAYLSFE
jgi:hypothetical protein